MNSPAIPEARPSAPWLDRLGMATSTLCAVHCAATALLMGTLTAIGASGLGSEWVEAAFLTASVLLGALSLGQGLLRHQILTPLLWFGAGLVLLLLIRPQLASPWLEVLSVAAGAGSIVRAHWINARLLAP